MTKQLETKYWFKTDCPDRDIITGYTSDRKILNRSRKLDRWLITTAMYCARMIHDTWNYDRFIDYLDANYITPAIRDELNMYIFGDIEVALYPCHDEETQETLREHPKYKRLFKNFDRVVRQSEERGFVKADRLSIGKGFDSQATISSNDTCQIMVYVLPVEETVKWEIHEIDLNDYNVFTRYGSYTGGSHLELPTDSVIKLRELQNEEILDWLEDSGDPT